MTATRHVYRVYLIVPSARLADLNAWIASEIDPTGESWVSATLSATGAAPATHGWTSFAATDADAIKWVVRLAATLGGTPPANFAAYTRDQKKAYLTAAAPALRSGVGVSVWIFDNDGVWPSPASLLAAVGLRVVTPPGP